MENKKELVKDSIRLALKNIRKFIRTNALQVKPKVVITYNIENPGVFYFHWDDRSIYINPKECRQFSKNKKYVATGYINSYKIEDVTYHEFGHLLDSKYNIYSEYSNTPQFKLNWNCESKREEWAECLNLYMTNPYLLKILSENYAPEIFEFFKNKYKSTTSCSKRTFKKIYDMWSDKVKYHCQKNFGISVIDGEITVNRKLVKKYFSR